MHCTLAAKRQSLKGFYTDRKRTRLSDTTTKGGVKICKENWHRLDAALIKRANITHIKILFSILQIF